MKYITPKRDDIMTVDMGNVIYTGKIVAIAKGVLYLFSDIWGGLTFNPYVNPNWKVASVQRGSDYYTPDEYGRLYQTSAFEDLEAG